MTSREKILSAIRKNAAGCYDMPDLECVDPVVFEDPLEKFVEMTSFTGGKAVVLEAGEDIDEVIAGLYPDASELDGGDVGVVEGRLAVAENGCVWIPQTMEDRSVLFISEFLIIIVDRNDIVSNMHQAYSAITMDEYGYGCFISGPSKTADIAQALVMGAQAARGVTVLIR